MNSSLNRRSFLKRTAAAAGTLTSAGLFTGPNILAADSPGKKLNCAFIGCGGRQMNHLEWIATESKDNVVAVVDPDEKQHAKVKDYLKKHNSDPDKAQAFTDYRVMFDKMANSIDVVVVATPNHHHAPASILALNHGKAVYCEKPLTHDIAEARTLRQMAAASKVPTQMGNQGHCMDGYRRLCEFVWADVVGNITETHSWTNRANGGVGPRPPSIPVPAGMHWDSWIGPAPYRDFHTDLHPHEWHGWYDFGNGSLGNMGCHVLDGVFWALKLQHPKTIEAEEIRGGSDERYPTGSRIRWDFPARGDMPPLKAYWYEGLRKDSTAKAGGKLNVASGDARNFPPLLKELMKQYPDEELDRPDSGTLYVGDKGVLYTETYGGKMHIVPREKMSEIKQPKPSLPRPKNVMTDFLEAVRSGQKQTAASFDYGAQLTEFTLLGNLAQHAGVGNKIEWDGPGMQVTNLKDLNQWIKRPYRKGWPA
ncbi:MAG TPA: Gfo/Idh/MocA family oxidoreductase [Candidatus Dormibacteraeota bacterium]|nr:Gfo/Idh/MocA family oxidoreductase [Candidatus Dormibacteraeota bacterium]